MNNFKNKKAKKRERGFIALISAIIISAIMMIFLFTANTAGFYSRFDALDSEYKRVATGLAESCVNQTLLRLSQNYSYDPATDPAYVSGLGVPINVGGGICYIVSTTPAGPRSGNSSDVTIYTQGIYKDAFSNFKTETTVYNNTDFDISVPPPSCYLQSSVASVYNGQPVVLQWSSSNAAQIKIIAENNHAYDINPASVPSGSRNIYLTASETFVGTATNSEGVTSRCATPPGATPASIIVQPPPTCADTVMMLDRTESMTESTAAPLSDEKNAAFSLMSLYQDAVPPGRVGAGIFGDGTDNYGLAPASIIGHLGTAFSVLSNSITIKLSSSAGFTNLASAISKGSAELNGPHHDLSKAKVLILVSDGVPNRPNDDPYGSASSAANAAKTSGGVQIFTIHFGGAGGRNFLATLASGNAVNNAGNSNSQASKDLENNDGDNFFISPSSSDMKEIFQDIAIKVCPAAVTPPVPPSPPPPPPPPPPSSIIIGSWQEY